MSDASSDVLAQADQPFRFLKQFNSVEFADHASCRDRLRRSDARWFPGEYLSSVFARELCERGAMRFKEVLESFEFYACVRNRIRSESVADLCCGHGLVGILFAMLERDIDQVVLLDKVRPKSFDFVLAAAQAVAPWTAEKITYVQAPLKRTLDHVEPGTAILGVHACGERTDQCIEHAIALNSTVALLPCCRRHRLHPSPDCLKSVLGADVAIDVDRTYRLHAAGYHVRWDQIPSSITEMNRVLIGKPLPAAGNQANAVLA
ncbi:methyltransferase [Neorhodopirellula lusitana]|uniref:methyltransferase n=1 Tax=Neorhodopirellula lusitana TaxID=445327 RepID=UPI00385091FF